MVDLLYYADWRNENSQRSYPFEETGYLSDRSNQLKIPSEWLIDASIAPLIGVAPFSLGTLTLEGPAIAVEIHDRDGLVVGSGRGDRGSYSPLAIYDADDRLIGTLVPGLEAHYPIYAAGDGVYHFGFGYADFVLSTILDLSALTGFFGFEIAGQVYESGDLIFVGEHGVQLAHEIVQEQKAEEILTVDRMRIHAMGDPQYLSRECDDISRRPLRFIREIVFQYGERTHVCKPNGLGNVLLLADSPAVSNSALQVRPTQDGIVIHLAGKSL